MPCSVLHHLSPDEVVQIISDIANGVTATEAAAVPANGAGYSSWVATATDGLHAVRSTLSAEQSLTTYLALKVFVTALSPEDQQAWRSKHTQQVKDLASAWVRHFGSYNTDQLMTVADCMSAMGIEMPVEWLEAHATAYEALAKQATETGVIRDMLESYHDAMQRAFGAGAVK